MTSHVAILRREYIDLVLEGTKTIESRLSRVRGPAFGRVHAGDTVYIKQSSGPFRAKATASRVLHLVMASPDDVEDVRVKFGDAIGGSMEYWRSKAQSRYCTLVWLADVTPVFRTPPYRRWRGFGPRAAWIVGPMRPVTSG